MKKVLLLGLAAVLFIGLITLLLSGVRIHEVGIMSAGAMIGLLIYNASERSDSK
jgi:hypothetical protein